MKGDVKGVTLFVLFTLPKKTICTSRRFHFYRETNVSTEQEHNLVLSTNASNLAENTR